MDAKERKARKQLCKLVDPKASKKTLRIEIARDVIAALDAKILTPEAGTYFEAEGLQGGGDRELRNVIGEATHITVCALGALFAAQVARFDSFRIDVNTRPGGKTFASYQKIYEKLEEVFTRGQRNLLEAAFEGWELMEEGGDERDPSNPWKSTYPDAEVRLRAICWNIVRNRGTFLPFDLEPPPEFRSEAGTIVG